jgi:hypothetical protein
MQCYGLHLPAPGCAILQQFMLLREHSGAAQLCDAVAVEQTIAQPDE